MPGFDNIWDYLPSYNTFFILIAKVYILVILLTVAGYGLYLGYKKYVGKPTARASSQANNKPDNKPKKDAVSETNKSTVGTGSQDQCQGTDAHLNSRPLGVGLELSVNGKQKLKYILWTGDMASTYTVISTLAEDEHVVVQPVFIEGMVSHTWAKLEKLCMTDLRKLILKRIPTARSRLLPIMNISAELDDKAFTEVFWPKFSKLPKPVQPYFPLVQWAYYYKIREPVVVAGFPVSVADTDLVNKTSIEQTLMDPQTGNLFPAKTILSMARASKVPFADILHKTCTCWSLTGSSSGRCGDCKGCLVIKAIQKRIIA